MEPEALKHRNEAGSWDVPFAHVSLYTEGSARGVMPVQSKLVAVGSPALDFTLPATSGSDLSLSQYRGKCCVVLVFLRGFR